MRGVWSGGRARRTPILCLLEIVVKSTRSACRGSPRSQFEHAGERVPRRRPNGALTRRDCGQVGTTSGLQAYLTDVWTGCYYVVFVARRRT